ncbi:MAG: hypothetical protein Kow00127_07430 [Bacteroidales bacterium]
MNVRKIISETIAPVRVEQSGTDALYYLDENHLTDIPLVDRTKLIGTISETDIYTLADPDKPLKDQIPAGLKRQYVVDGQHITDALQVMASERIFVLPVLDADENFIGCLTGTDLIVHMGRFMALDLQGAILVLEISRHDWVLSQIAQIAESLDIRILDVILTPKNDTNLVEVTIKVNTFEIQTLIQELNRYNYIVKATYTRSEKMRDDLRDRYDALMKYLNI